MFFHHPFAVKARFDYSLVLTYAAPAEQLAPLLPPCLTADTWQAQTGFVAVAMVQTRALRPAMLPAWLGSSFFLIGYRIFVRYTNVAGRRLRGLYILSSATDSGKMTLLGNMLTGYRYRKVDVECSDNAGDITITSEAAGLHVRISGGGAETTLPQGSPFGSWKEARRFAGPLPHTFSYNGHSKRVMIVEGVREHWTPQPLAVAQADVSFPQMLDGVDLSLASAFVVRDIDYHWKAGKTDQWAI